MSGCNNCTPEGLCLGGLFPCYAWKLAHGRLKQRYLGNKSIAPLPFEAGGGGFDGELRASFDPFYPRFWEERLYEPRDNKQSKGIFVCDMGDLFGIGIPEHWTQQILLTAELSRQHRFYLLTKQPQNLIKWSPFPENCWVGVTATTELSYVEAVAELANIEAKVKYISFEPLLERIRNTGAFMKSAGINWLIIGACTGSYQEMQMLRQWGNCPDLRTMAWGNKWTAQPKIEWVREIVEAADKAGIPVFLKENLVPLIAGKGTLEGLFYKDCRLRQEMPKGVK